MKLNKKNSESVRLIKDLPLDPLQNDTEEKRRLLRHEQGREEARGTVWEQTGGYEAPEAGRIF